MECTSRSCVKVCSAKSIQVLTPAATGRGMEWIWRSRDIHNGRHDSADSRSSPDMPAAVSAAATGRRWFCYEARPDCGPWIAGISVGAGRSTAGADRQGVGGSSPASRQTCCNSVGIQRWGGLALYVGIATMRVCGNFAIYRIAQHGNAIFRAFSEAGRSGEINWRRRRDSTRVYSSSLVFLKNHDAGGVTGIHGGLLGGILLPRGPIDDSPRWDDRRHPSEPCSAPLVELVECSR